jgi:hypothetical protein
VKNQKERENFLKKLAPDSIIVEPIHGSHQLITGKLLDEFVYKQSSAKASQIGIFIYEYARAYMYQLVFSRYECLYTDTDSAFMREDVYKRFRAENSQFDFIAQNRDKEMGDFEEEFGDKTFSTEYAVIRPKFYMVLPFDKDGNFLKGKAKTKVKGVNLKRDKLIVDSNNPIITKANNEISRIDYHDLYEKDDESGQIIPLASLSGIKRLYENIIKDKVAYVLCSQFMKEMHKFEIRRRIGFKRLE